MRMQLDSEKKLIFLRDRKSTRLNSSHLVISYAVFCLKKKTDRAHLLERNGHVPFLADQQHIVIPAAEIDALVARRVASATLWNHEMLHAGQAVVMSDV